MKSKIDQVRVVSKFLWFPKKLPQLRSINNRDDPQEHRWLERCKVRQRCSWEYCLMADARKYFWKDIAWENEENE
jgi:hypothetical protein